MLTLEVGSNVCAIAKPAVTSMSAPAVWKAANRNWATSPKAKPMIASLTASDAKATTPSGTVPPSAATIGRVT